MAEIGRFRSNFSNPRGSHSLTDSQKPQNFPTVWAFPRNWWEKLGISMDYPRKFGNFQKMDGFDKISIKNSEIPDFHENFREISDFSSNLKIPRKFDQIPSKRESMKSKNRTSWKIDSERCFARFPVTPVRRCFWSSENRWILINFLRISEISEKFHRFYGKLKKIHENQRNFGKSEKKHQNPQKMRYLEENLQ